MNAPTIIVGLIVLAVFAAIVGKGRCRCGETTRHS